MSFTYPSELELLEFFLIEPERQDTIYLYNVTDIMGVNLIFTFDIMDDSIQTTLKLQGYEIANIAMEGLKKIWIDNTNKDKSYLYADFSSKNIIRLILTMQPNIEVNWLRLIG